MIADGTCTIYILFLCIRTTRGDSIIEGKTTMMWDRGINFKERTISFEKVNSFSRVFYIHSDNIYIYKHDLKDRKIPKEK